MKDKPKNPQAFYAGMLLRDYFAAKAFDKAYGEALVQAKIQANIDGKGGKYDCTSADNLAYIAELAYRYADAMLAERSKSDE